MNRRLFLATLPVVFSGCVGNLEGPEADKAETLIREAINEEREAAGVGALAPDDSLSATARSHSQDMHDRDFYRHRNPEGEEPWDRAACRAGEVIHRGEIGAMNNSGSDETYQTRDTDELAAFVVDGWRGSQSHYQNMVDRQWQSVGVGIYIGDDEFFATAMFC